MTSFFSGRRNRSESQGETPPQATNPLSPVASGSAKPVPQTLGFETVLGPSTVLEGKLTCSGNIRLDGEFSGSLEITGNVLVGETANINAHIDAKNISIAGAVRGNVTGSRVQLLRTGRVWGDIQAAALTTEEGAFIDGKISMKLADEAPSPEEATVEDDTATPTPPTDASDETESASDAPENATETEDKKQDD